MTYPHMKYFYPHTFQNENFIHNLNQSNSIENQNKDNFNLNHKVSKEEYKKSIIGQNNRFLIDLNLDDIIIIGLIIFLITSDSKIDYLLIIILLLLFLEQ